MKKVLSILMAMAMVLSLAACGGGDAPAETTAPAPAETTAPAPAETTAPAPAETSAPEADGETYNLIVSLTKGEKNTTALQDYLKEIEEASNGRITFEIYYSGQLLAVPEIPQGLDTGVADITEFVLSEFSTMFPLSSTIVGMPFMGMTNDTIKTFQMLYDEFPEIQKEFSDNNMVLLSYLCTQPYNFHLTGSDPVVLPEDLAGLKVITTRTDITNFLSSVGASAVASAPPDFYTNLSNGVVDGTLLHYNMMYNNGLIETCKQHLLVEEGGGLYMDTSVYVMSSGAWEKLPADLQALFTDPDRVERFFVNNQETLEADGAKGLATSQEMGNAIHYMSADELAAWEAAFAPINEATLASLDGQGLPATEIHARAQEIIAELKG